MPNYRFEYDLVPENLFLVFETLLAESKLLEPEARTVVPWSNGVGEGNDLNKNPSAGSIEESLAAHGFSPEQIESVVERGIETCLLY